MPISQLLTQKKELLLSYSIKKPKHQMDNLLQFKSGNRTNMVPDYAEAHITASIELISANN